ncbi:MAG: PVC-type heme-binding CxxCH protein [Fuerstiella sp.]
MKLHSTTFSVFIVLAISCSQSFAQTAPHLKAALNDAGDQVEIFRADSSQPIVTHVARPDFRPYLHPIVAPDGKGVLTELSPEHHKHQTGFFWGFTRVNGRDYFHHPDGTYWRRSAVRILTAEAATSNDSVQWQTVYDLLAEDGSVVLQESQIWSMTATKGTYTLDLQWTGDAQTDVTVSKYDYGGLFLRMPWKPGMEGEVVNGARQRGMRAEGQRSVWLDVGLQVEGREDMAHVAIFDHPSNKGFPQPWRVDGQLGVGPVRARLGDWKIAKGAKETIKHQLFFFNGPLNDVEVTDKWSQFSGQNMAYAQWNQAQQEGRQAEFLTPQKAVDNMTLQPGFKANVWASEPMMTQPMAFCWDAKGRIWIAENRDYETRGTGFSNSGDSRILILEDTNHDGVSDTRKVFAEGIPFPAGMAVGMGGLWLGAPPNLLFLPDADGDDKADADKTEVRLTGWGIRDRHETLNSFHWGPDGWLYGCQGYATPSKVGKPAGKGKLFSHKEAFPEDIKFDGKPVDINGGVWRYHPTKDRFEVVAHGFSNPWGIDYDAKGQIFITACVIPHLWHVVPGGIYHRQGGSHFSKYVYDDIKTIANHRHRSAHGGARVYQSDAFPDQYKGRIFMANIHEHAVLTDILEPQGSGFVGRHGDDFMLANNAQWIGFSMEIGPDGAIYVLDWHDADICGKEVLNKETGRIFRIAAEASSAVDFPNRYKDLTTLSDLQLAELQTVESAWHARQARTILQHRSNTGTIDAAAIASLQSQFADSKSADQRLTAMWALHVTKQLSAEVLERSLNDKDEHVRAWAIQLLCEDAAPSDAVARTFAAMARDDSSAVVRLYLAAAVQRLASNQQWAVLEQLALHGEDVADHNLPKMIWFALEPLVAGNAERALALAESSNIPLVTRHTARRLGDAEQFETLIAKIGSTSRNQLDMLLGLRDSLEGRYDVKAPANWATVYSQLRKAGGDQAKIALQLSQQFGDTVAAGTMLATLKDASANVNDRKQALQGLVGRKRPELKQTLLELFNDDALRSDAIRAVAAFDDATLADALLKRYPQLSEADKLEVVHTLAARSGSGWKLTQAIKDGTVAKRDVPAYVARLLRRVVGNGFVEVWGAIDELSADKEAMFVRYRSLLTENAIAAADPANGRALFNRTCGACHKMYGHGGVIGPDITGANRGNLEYLLGNILTPSAIIQDAYKMHIVLTDDGRVYSGIPAEENDRSLKLRIANRTEPVTIAKSQIESREIAPISMMPEGILTTLTDSEVLDLLSYLQGQKQTELPVTKN